MIYIWKIDQKDDTNLNMSSIVIMFDSSNMDQTWNFSPHFQTNE